MLQEHWKDFNKFHKKYLVFKKVERPLEEIEEMRRKKHKKGKKIPDDITNDKAWSFWISWV